MADKKMNAFTPVANAEYVYAEAADGSQVKIKKSVIAGLIREEIKETFLQNNKEVLKDCDIVGGYDNNGIYVVDGNTKNIPPLTLSFKSAILFKLFSPGIIYQLCIETQTNNCWFRWYSTKWSGWKQI